MQGDDSESRVRDAVRLGLMLRFLTVAALPDDGRGVLTRRSSSARNRVGSQVFDRRTGRGDYALAV